VPWDGGDFADGGTGMPSGQLEDDRLLDACDVSTNFP
jgi:hypothetical protein